MYVDHDPTVVEKSAELFDGRDNLAAILGDVLRPEEILEDPDLQRFIDWSRPVAVQLFATMHFIGDGDGPKEIMATFRERMSPGSFLALSHACGIENQEAADEATKEWKQTRSSLTLRPPSQVEELFAGFELVGHWRLVTTAEWGTTAPPTTGQAVLLCGVGKVTK